ncbi:uncharacterized protein LOC114525081 [Dendronephthya gigantea]|uniref:uncharacterized protein LOC114525081 n=1 Tax=Dendronephthya gigantea TaxID=151771 RepID=UPI00106C5540|nr:uncharacterized protein LOC114525081 [Dendronephthya gigantea]
MDVYVAIRHFENGDELFFGITVTVIILSSILVNIYATTTLKKTKWNVRRFLCVSHFSMIYLFIKEIFRWFEEKRPEIAHPCGGEKHFSVCDCSQCKEQLEQSVEASLGMSHTRSMETFIESVPQFLLQVYIMVYKDSYPWYTIVSAAFSFISLVFSVYMLEKNYWIKKLITDRPDYLKPITF